VSRCVRTIATALGLATCVAGLSTGPVLANPKVCSGRNLLTEMKTSDPDLYAEVRKSADAMVNNRGLLWKIEDAEHPDRAPSYLFGTIHLTDDRVAKMPAAAEKAFNETSRVAIEVEDLSPPRVAEALQTLVSRGAVHTKAGGLSGMLTPKELTSASKVLGKSGLDQATFSQVRPWVALVMLGTPDCERSRLVGGRRALDNVIAERAENRGMGTFGLETLELQLMAMSAIPDKDQLALLKSQLADPTRVNDTIETTLQLYLAGDVGAIWPLQIALAKKAGVDPTVFESFEQNLVTERNERMFGRLSMHLDRGGLFVAVGALHLPGKMGLVQMVRDAGYKITLMRASRLQGRENSLRLQASGRLAASGGGRSQRHAGLWVLRGRSPRDPSGGE
jgi:uncharacterized protein